jgi:hypothetical protein
VTVRALVRARSEWQDAGAFPLRIDTVTMTPQGPRYAHFMPYPCPIPSRLVDPATAL